MVIERTVEHGVRREIDREDSAEQYLAFLTISHPSLIEPIRVVANPVDCILGGELYQRSGFNVTILSDTDEPPFAQLRIQNVDRRIGAALRRIDQPATLKLEVIPGSEFDQSVDPHTEIAADNTLTWDTVTWDTVTWIKGGSLSAPRTYSADGLNLIGVKVNVLDITGRLQTRDYSKEQWPGTLTTQANFPGLYR